MIDWIKDKLEVLFDFTLDFLEGFHSVMCALPTIGVVFEDAPIIGYPIFFASVGCTIWFMFFDGANVYLNLFN